jgi:ubiquitin-protein ligase
MSGYNGKTALRRILKDLKEVREDPLDNASMDVPEDSDDIFEVHCNIVIPYGIYEGLVIHFILKMNEYFPVSSPAGFMPEDYPFTEREHEHLHDNGICNDYLSNYKNWFNSQDRGKIQAGVGWSPGITLKSLLLAMTHFFAATDRPEPSEDVINDVREKVDNYHCEKCGHTNSGPYPPLKITNPKNEEEKEGEDSNLEQTNEEKEDSNLKQAKEMLICAISKESYLDFQDSMVLGYPINLNVDYRDRLWTTLIPELMSYEQYVLQIQEKGFEKLERFNKIRLRTASGAPFTHWLPIYLNEDHYQKNKQYIYNTMSVISNGIEGTSDNDFQPFMVLRVLPCLMNKMVVAMMKKDLHESTLAIYAYCHYLALFFRMLEEYPFLRTEMDTRIFAFFTSYKGRHKDNVPDLGEFLIWLCISEKFDYYQQHARKVYLSEKFARQVLWTVKACGKGMVFEKDVNRRLEKTFKAAEVSNKLLVFNLMASKFFIFKGVQKKLNDNFGMPPEGVIQEFQKVIRNIKNIENYETFLQAISFDRELSTKQKIVDFLNDARNISEYQGYTTIYKTKNPYFFNKEKYILIPSSSRRPKGYSEAVKKDKVPQHSKKIPLGANTFAVLAK